MLSIYSSLIAVMVCIKNLMHVQQHLAAGTIVSLRQHALELHATLLPQERHGFPYGHPCGATCAECLHHILPTQIHGTHCHNWWEVL